jgi:dTDP-4-amino-4,6-dideoxygalactose transaminase
MGYNLKPLDLQGAIGIEQLKKLEEIEANRLMPNEEQKRRIQQNLGISLKIDTISA